MAKDDLAMLQLRAYGPNQEPLTRDESARLSELQPGAVDQTADEGERKSPLPLSGTRARFGWVTVAIFTVVLAGFAGFWFGAAGAEPRDSFGPDSGAGAGVQLPDGSWGPFSDAECTTNIDASDGTLTSVTCTCEDVADSR